MRRVDQDDDDVIITKITKMNETTIKLFLEYEKEIQEKEKEEDRQRRKDDREHELMLFSMLCSRLGPYPPHQFQPPGPPPPSQQQQHSVDDDEDVYTGLQYQF